MTIPDEAVQAAVTAMNTNDMVAYDSLKSRQSADAKRILTAALPFLQGVKVDEKQYVDCACTKIQQDESCSVGYPSLFCEICDGKGIAPSPRANALEEGDLLNRAALIIEGRCTAVNSDFIQSRERHLPDRQEAAMSDRITQKYLRRWPDSKRSKSWAGRLVHIQTENGVWRTDGKGYTYAGKDDAWVLPFEDAQKQVAHCGPEKQATFIAVTRPAAPVEGLETVEYQVYDVYGRWQSVRKFVYDLNTDQKRDCRELVTRSQAEAIIAAVRADYAKLVEQTIQQQKQIENIEADNAAANNDTLAAEAELSIVRKDRDGIDIALAAEKASVTALQKMLALREADNAALTARVKEWEAAIDHSEGDYWRFLHNQCLELGGACNALETQLAAAEKALEDMIDGYQEYDFVDGKPVLRPIEKQSSWIQRARSALEGKP